MKPNVAYHSALTEAKIIRNIYRGMLSMIVRRQVHSSRDLPM